MAGQIRDPSTGRADAVIYYPVTRHKLPMQRLVQPFGYGRLEPVADNSTKAGRAESRRAVAEKLFRRGCWKW